MSQMNKWKQSQVLAAAAVAAAVKVMSLVCHQTLIMIMVINISPSPTHVTTPTALHQLGIHFKTVMYTSCNILLNCLF